MTAGPGRSSVPRALFLVLAALAVTGLGPGNAAAQSAAELRARIERHGCDRAQYASSPGCRALYERLRVAEARRGRRPRSSSSGIFGFLFGSSRSRSRRPAPERRAPYSADNRPYGYDYDSARSGYGAYRTLCVRMCDGYYFPISFSAGRGQFDRDARQCESSCEAPARLFVHRSPGGSVERMVDLQGRSYSAIPNAFRYREEYVEECRCKPEPWSEEAQAMYAARAAGSGEMDAERRIAGQGGEGPAGDRDAATSYRRPRPDPGVARRDTRSRERPAYSAGDVRPDGRWWAGSW